MQYKTRTRNRIATKNPTGCSCSSGQVIGYLRMQYTWRSFSTHWWVTAPLEAPWQRLSSWISHGRLGAHFGSRVFTVSHRPRQARQLQVTESRGQIRTGQLQVTVSRGPRQAEQRQVTVTREPRRTGQLQATVSRGPRQAGQLQVNQTTYVDNFFDLSNLRA